MSIADEIRETGSSEQTSQVLETNEKQKDVLDSVKKLDQQNIVKDIESQNIEETLNLEVETEKVSRIIDDNQEIVAEGVYGTSPWYLTVSGVLHFNEGEFPYSDSRTEKEWEQSYIVDGQEFFAEKIVFDGKVRANEQSDSLFAGHDNNAKPGMSIKAFENIELLDTSNVINMGVMFAGNSQSAKSGKNLPQTGETKTVWQILLGSSLLIGLAGLFFIRQKKEVK